MEEGKEKMSGEGGKETTIEDKGGESDLKGSICGRGTSGRGVRGRGARGKRARGKGGRGGKGQNDGVKKKKKTLSDTKSNTSMEDTDEGKF
jgi:hypothetical protein